jgi:ketosteroid isomerase-like protein
MYHLMVRRLARRNFERLTAGDWQPILDGLAPDVIHTYAGQNAVGGTRTALADVRRWFERVYRLFPSFHEEVREILVGGWPWDTVAAVQWVATTHSSILNETLEIHGVHMVRFRWGKVTELQAYPDTEKFTAYLARLAAAGVDEAAAPPIES